MNSVIHVFYEYVMCISRHVPNKNENKPSQVSVKAGSSMYQGKDTNKVKTFSIVI